MRRHDPRDDPAAGAAVVLLGLWLAIGAVALGRLLMSWVLT